jgi:DNA processing protein
LWHHRGVVDAVHAPETLLWPFNEQERKHAPKELFVAGNADLLRAGPCVAVVGSRKASPAGLDRARKLADLLTARDVIVVSGLAAGVDTAAHETAIERGGRTIAVLGTPLTECFPAQNAALQQRIMRDHLAVSQFAPGTRVGRHTFPMRNRTMALIADATVIVEADERSGTINQGWEALRLGRPLWIAASLFQRRDLGFPAKLAFYGAEQLSDVTFPRLLELLPKGRRDVPAELPF